MLIKKIMVITTFFGNLLILLYQGYIEHIYGERIVIMKH